MRTEYGSGGGAKTESAGIHASTFQPLGSRSQRKPLHQGAPYERVALPLMAGGARYEQVFAEKTATSKVMNERGPSSRQSR